MKKGLLVLFTLVSGFVGLGQTTIASLNRQTPTDQFTNAISVTYRATFNAPVSGVVVGDFTLGLTLTDANIASVTAVTGAPDTQWDIVVDSYTAEGDLRLDFTDGGGGITPDVTNTLQGQIYTIDQTEFEIATIDRLTPAAERTNATTVTFLVTFNEDVVNVGVSDFAIEAGGATGTITTVTFLVTFNEDVVNVGVSDFAIEAGGATGTINSVTANSATEYEVELTTVAEAGTDVLEISLDGGNDIEDLAGNSFSGTYGTVETYTIDQTDPAQLTIGSITTGGTSVVAGYWNSTNDELSVVVPLTDTDASLDGGTIQLLLSNDNFGTSSNLGSGYTITNGERLAGTKTIVITDPDILELNSEFGENETLYFSAIITDLAGNDTEQTPSATTLYVDETSPAAFTTGDVLTTGGNEVDDYWNSTNTGVEVTIPLPTAGDETFEGGTIQLQARISSGAFANIGGVYTIDSDDVTAESTIVSLTEAQIELITGYAQGVSLQFLAIISDEAGNPATTGAQSATSLFVDTIDPIISTAVTGDANSDGQIDRIFITFNENILDSEIDLTVAAGVTDNFQIDGYDISSIDLGTADDDEVTIILTPLLTPDTDATPDITFFANVTTDVAGNTLTVNQDFAATEDGAAPVPLTASYLNVTQSIANNGTVDRVDIVFSEDITGSTIENGDWTFPNNPGSLVVSSGVIATNTVRLTVTGGAINTTQFGATTVRYTNQGTSNSITDGDNPTATSADISVDDAAAPLFSYIDSELVFELAFNNAYIDIEFTEGLYANSDGTGGLEAADFDLVFDDGSGTSVFTLLSAKQPDATTSGAASDLVGGESLIRIFFNITGTTNGTETVIISPTNGTSIYDLNGNAMGTGGSGQTTGSVPLFNAAGYIESLGAYSSISSIATSDPGTPANQIVFQFRITNPFSGSGDRSVRFNGITIIKGANDTTGDWDDLIQGIRLEQNGSTGNNTTSATIGASQIAITGINGNNNQWGDIDKGANKTYNLKIWLKTSQVDNVNIDDFIAQFRLIGTNFSYLSAANYQLNALSDASSNDIAIDVVATELRFITEPTTNTAADTDFGATLAATDVNGNYDWDYAQDATIAINALGTGASATVNISSASSLTKSPTNGLYTWTDLEVDAGGNMTFVGYSTAFPLLNGGVYPNEVAGSSNAVSGTINFYDHQSDVIENIAATLTSNINYLRYDGVNPVTNANGILVGSFTIQDDGSDPDADSRSTILQEIEFSIDGDEFIDRLALYTAGGTLLDEEEITTGSVTFAFADQTITDNGTLTVNLYASFETTITDNTQIDFTITDITSNSAVTESGFPAAYTGGGATVTPAGNENRLNVSASKLVFTSVPVSIPDRQSLFSVTVEARDVNDNLDTDFTKLLRIIPSSGEFLDYTSRPLAGEIPEVNISAGEATLDDLLISVTGNVDFSIYDVNSDNNINAAVPADVNANGIPDQVDVLITTGTDANSNGIDDNFEIATTGGTDSNLNGIDDDYDNLITLSTGNLVVGDTDTPDLEVAGSIPANGSVVAVADDQLTLRFDELVQVGTGKIRVYDQSNISAPFDIVDVSGSNTVTTDSDVEVTLNKFLSKDKSYFVTIEAGTFSDFSTSPASENDYEGFLSIGGWQFAIPQTAPVLLSTNPADTDAGVRVSKIITLFFDEPVYTGSGANITLTNVGGATLNIDPTTGNNAAGDGETVITGYGTTELVINPRANFDANSTVTVNIPAAALENNIELTLTAPYSFSFDTEMAPDLLLVDNFVPADGANTVAVNTTQLQINFDENVAKGTGSIRLYMDVDNTLLYEWDVDDAEISIASDVVTISLTTLLNEIVELPGETGFYVTMDDGVFSSVATGNVYTGIFNTTTWNFTTDAETTAPAIVFASVGVLDITPRDNASNVAVTTNELIIEFTEPIEAVAGRYIEVRLVETGGLIERIEATNAAVDITGKTVTIDLAVAFSSSSKYFINVDAGAFTDLGSNANQFAGIFGSSTWNFTTDASDDGQGPAIIALSPADNATDVSVTTAITASFNEQVYLGTGNVSFYNASTDAVLFTVPVANLVVNSNQITIPISAGSQDSLLYNTEYEISFPGTAIKDVNENFYSGNANNSGVWTFTTIADTFFPLLTSIANISNVVLDTAANGDPNVTIEENATILRLIFNEPVTATSNAGENRNIRLFYKDENYRLRNADDELLVNTFTNSTLNSQTRIRYVDNFTDLNNVASSRFVLLDYSGLDELPAGSDISIDIPVGAFIDANDNLFQGLAQNLNTHTFTVGDADDTNLAPLVSTYEPVSGTVGAASLTTALIIDFNEPVTPNGGTINLNFWVNGGTANGGTDFTFNADNGLASNANTRYTYTLPEKLKGSNQYYVAFDADAYRDTDIVPNPIAAFVGSASPITTVADTDRPLIENLTNTSSTTLTSTPGTVQLSEDEVELYLTFSEPVITTNTAGENGSIRFYYKDTNYPLRYAQQELIINTYTNSNLNGGTAIRFVDDLTTPADVTTPTRYVIIDLSTATTADFFPVGSDISIDIAQYSFVDNSGNTFEGVNQTSNNYTFTVVDNGASRAPALVRYFPGTPGTVGATNASLTTTLVIDFTEPVTTTVALISVNFVANGGTDFTMAASTGVSSNAGTRYTYTLPEKLKGLSDYYISFPIGTFDDLDGNDIAAYNDGGTLNYDFRTVADTDRPLIENLTNTSSTTLTSTPATVQLSEDEVELYLTFSEPVIATNTAGENGSIRFYYKDTNYPLRYAQQELIINTYTNSNLNGGTSIRFVDDLTTPADVTTPTRYVIIDLSTATIADFFPVGSDISIDIAQNSFVDNSGNTFEGVNQTSNNYTFTVVDNGASRAPALVRYFPGTPGTVGATNASLTTTLVIDFTEPVTTTAALISVNFVANGGTDFTMAASTGVSSNAGTRYTYTLPEKLKGLSDYYISFPIGTFDDLEGNDIAAYNDGGTLNYDFRTVADTDRPVFESVTNTSNAALDGAGTIQLTEDGAQIRFTFDEPVRATAGSNADIRLYYRNDNYPLYNATNELVINSFNWSNKTGAVGGNPAVVKFVTDFTTNTAVASPTVYTRYVLFDLSVLATDLPVGEIISLNISQNAFRDASTNTTAAIDQAANLYTFTVIGNGQNIAPAVAQYFPANTDGGGDATLSSNIVFDFTEPVTAVSGNLSFYFESDNTVDFVVAATSGVVTNGGTRFTYSIPEAMKGNNTYYITFDASTFADTEPTPRNIGAFNGSGTPFTTQTDAVRPQLVEVSPADNATGVVNANNIVLTFSEPVTASASSGDIIIYNASDNSEFYRINVFDNSNLGVGPTIVTTDLNSDPSTVITISLTALNTQKTIKPGTDWIILLEENVVQDLSTAPNGNIAFAAGALVADGSYTIRIADDASVPVITALSPADGTTTVGVNSDFVITFQEAVLAQSGAKINIRYSDGTPMLRWDATDGVASQGNSVFTYSLADSEIGATSLFGNQAYHVRIDANAFREQNGNNEGFAGISDNTTWNFSTANEAIVPTYTFTPVDGATNFTYNGNFVITFNERVTANAVNITVYYDDGDGNAGNDVVATQFLANSGTVNTTTNYTGSIFTYSPALDGNTNYYVNIGNAAFQDLNGTPNTTTVVNDLTTWNFSTGTEAVAPLITSATYSSTGLNPNNAITIALTFNERVTTSTGELYIEYGDTQNNEVYRFSAGSGTINNSTSPSNSVITYTIPGGTLRGTNTYYLGITADAFRDAVGNQLAALAADGSTVLSSFTTDADGNNPVIVSLTPADGATNVATNGTSLIITFDQPITPNNSGTIEIRYLSSDELILNAARSANYTILPLTNGVGSISNTRWTYAIPAGTLEGSSDLYVNILASSFADNDGSNLPAISDNTTWNFRTATGGTNPDVLALSPDDESTGIDIRTDLFLTFDEPVYPTNNNITISGGPNGDIVINAQDDTQVINATGSTGVGTKTIRINPTNDLHGNSFSGNSNMATTQYEVSFPSGTFVDVAGNAYDLSSDATFGNNWTFTTRSSSYPSDVNTVALGSVPTMISCLDNLYIDQQETIYIKETASTDFRAGGTVIFTISDGFEFEPSVGTVSAASGSATVTSVTIAASTITFTLGNTGASGANGTVDVLAISGLRIRYTGSSLSATGNVKRSGGTADLYGMSVSHQVSILNITVESVTAPAIVTVAPTAGQLQLSNVTFCLASSYSNPANANYDDSYGTGNSSNAYDDVLVNIQYTGADYEYRIYRDEAISDQVGTSFIGAGAASASLDFDDFFTAGDYAALTAGTISRWVTYVNPNGCESEPTEVVFTIYGLPDAETIAGRDYDDAQSTSKLSVCGDDEVTLGRSTNEALEEAGYSFYWTGENIDGEGIENDANPTFNAPMNGGFAAPRTEQYTLRVSNEYGCQDPVTANVNVVIDREVQPHIFSQNGLTFTEIVTTGQPIFGDFGDGDADFGVNTTDPTATDNSLVVGIGANGTATTDHYYTAEPYAGRTADGTTYSFSFAGNGLGNTTDNPSYHRVTFTPSAVGAGEYDITYTLIENFTGCQASETLTITVLSSEDNIFNVANFEDNPVDNSQLIASVDDGDLSTTDTPVIKHLVTTLNSGVYTFQRFEGPGIYQDGFVMTVSDASGMAVGETILGEITLSGTRTKGTITEISGNVLTMDQVEGTFTAGDELYDNASTPVALGETVVSIGNATEVALRMAADVSGLTIGTTYTATGSGAQGRVIDFFEENVIIEVISGTFADGDGLGGSTVEAIYGNFEINLANAFSATPASEFLVVNSNGTATATLELVVVEIATSSPFVFGSKELVIAPLPTVTFANVAEYYSDINPNNVNQSVDIDLTLTNNGANTPVRNNVPPVDYTLTVNAGVGVDNSGNSLVISGSVIDFVNIINHATIGLTANDLSNFRDEITYTLNVRSQASNDPFFEDFNSEFGSPVTLETTFTLFKRQDRPTLVIDGSSNAFVSDISEDIDVDRDYFVEYCEFDAISNVVVTAANDNLATTIRWYQNNAAGDGKGDQLAVSNGRNVAAFTLFGTSTPSPGTYVFRFTQVSNIEPNSSSFAGTESDFSTLTFVIHDVPKAPRLDVASAGSTTGQEQTIGEKYVFEYCEDEEVDDLNIFRGGIDQDFDANDAADNDWIFAGGSSNQNGRLELPTSSSVRSEYLDKVNQISFTVASSDGNPVSVEVRYFVDQTSASGFEVLETITTSSTVGSTYTYTIERFNDVDITEVNSAIRFIASSDNGTANVYIDDFSTQAMISGQTVYDWFVHDGTDYVLIDGFETDTRDVNDGLNVGRIASVGNTSPTAAELFQAYNDLVPGISTDGDNTPPPGTYTFYVSRREDINDDNDVNYDGCASEKATIEINIYGIPGTPTGFTTDINAASAVAPSGNNVTYNTRIAPGDVIRTPQLTNVGYRWYYDNTTAEQQTLQFQQVTESGTITFSQVTDIFGSVPVSSNGFYAPTSKLEDNIYLAQVTNLLNRKTNASIVTSYVGCETPAALRQAVDITIYPIEEIPVVGVFNYERNLKYYDDEADDVGNYVEFDYIANKLNGDTLFYAQSFYTDALNDQVFRWYFSDANGSRSTNQRVPNSQSTSDPRDTVVSAADLLIGGITNNITVYFLVTQVSDIEPNDKFGGVESEGTLVRINIYNTPNAPAQASSTTSSSPGTLNFYYCEGETIDPLTVKSYDEDVSTNLFYWYRSLADANAQDSTLRLSTADARGLTIQPAELLNDDVATNPDENGQAVVPTDLSGNPIPGTYTFYVTQSSNKKYAPNSGFSGDPFFGSESAPLTLTIYVREVPVSPAVVDQTLFICEDVLTPTYRISGFNNRITYVWFDGNNDEQARGQTFTPSDNVDANEDNIVGFYEYSVTQVTDINLNNEGFEGCSSPVTPLELTVREIPNAPIMTSPLETVSGVNRYVYTICEGDAILDFEINNPELVSTTVYKWFNFEDLQIGQGEIFKPGIFISQNNLTPEVANDFPFRARVTTNINTAENFAGCTSPVTAVIQRINGLPSLSFVGITNNQAICIENETYTFTARSIGISGVGEFSLYPDFSTAGRGLTKITDTNPSVETARFNLTELHLADDDLLNPVDIADRKEVGGRFTTRNVYFRFTDVNTCVNTTVLNNFITNSDPAIDFRIDGVDGRTIEEFETCLNEEFNVFAERVFLLEGIQAETGAGIGTNGQDSRFSIFEKDGAEIGFGILSDFDAVAEFSPVVARRNLSTTDEDIQDYAPTSVYTLRFTHRDANGCTNFAENDIVVHPLPEFRRDANDIVIANKACAADTVDFNVNLSNLPDDQATYFWRLRNDPVTNANEINGNGNINNITVLADDFGIGGGLIRVTVRAVDDATGCAFEVFDDKSIGVIPRSSFAWRNITAGNNTEFQFREDRINDLNQVAEFRFDLYEDFNTDDPSSLVYTAVRGRSANPLVNEIVNFANIQSTIEPGLYTAKVRTISTAACSDSVYRSFNILPLLPVPESGILHTFDLDESDYGWHTDSISVDRFSDSRYSTWEQVVPAGATINQNNVPDNITGRAWITNADGAYAGGGLDRSAAENSWVYSPAFDISLLQKPAISFNFVSHLQRTDGVVMQYSLNDGNSWETIGTFSFDEGESGVNWYNFANLPGNPGNFDEPSLFGYNRDGVGWTNQTSNYDWVYSSHKLDNRDVNGNYIIPQENWREIRFRFALGSRTGVKQDEVGNNLEGFAFDNFRIYDRQKIVLFESFSSALNQDSETAAEIIQERVAKVGEGVAWINYFTDLDGGSNRDDELFNRNKIDPKARGSYYGVSNVPTSVIDGLIASKNPNSTSTSPRLLGWNEFALNKAELVEPEFDIALTLEDTPDDILKVRGTFTSLKRYPNKDTELSFRFMVVERFITGQSIGVYTPTDTIRNVLRKILPDASGFIRKDTVGIGQSFVFGDDAEEDLEWSIDRVLNPNNLRVIAFVQNEVTRKIYQVAYLDIEGKQNTTTGLSENLGIGSQFNIYPNPADKDFRLTFEKPLSVNATWTIFDQSGRIMQHGVLHKNQGEVVIDTRSLSNGVYLIQVFHDQYQWLPKRFMILHK